ncbi:hypothetical protein D7Y09_04095 [bacterium 1XD42-1]|nr:hypothetical protein D7X25_08430 [bacterium 1XD42-8]RKJ66467.1 hypothetical protein D7Y09_04095 [bacterium 1XD42-1]
MCCRKNFLDFYRIFGKEYKIHGFLPSYFVRLICKNQGIDKFKSLDFPANSPLDLTNGIFFAYNCDSLRDFPEKFPKETLPAEKLAERMPDDGREDMTKLLNGAETAFRFLRSRLAALCFLFVAVTVIIFQICDRMHAVVCTTEATHRSLHFVLEDNAQEAAARFGGQAETEDRYINLATVSSLTATVTVDGKNFSRQVPNGTTVGELLHQEEISYDGNDLLTPAAEKPLEEGDRIVLQRVEIEEYTEDEIIPYKTIHKNSPLLGYGKTKVLQTGSDGIRTKTYTRCTVDGKEEELQLLGEKISKTAVDEIILVGSNIPISPLDFGFEVDEYGKPLHYKRLLTNQVATGYSARPGALTASGRAAVVGTVAVNPNIIPYGSKLYITSADGQFIYGCAIAADTGTGLMQGIIDVDLFYDTYRESAMNGRKIVDIYVLE